ncbi:MAG: hypothetical protein WA268_04875 [Xanthobacteraceae bacterium]
MIEEAKDLIARWQDWAPERVAVICAMSRACAVLCYGTEFPEIAGLPLGGPPVFIIQDEDGLPMRLCGEFRHAVNLAAEHGFVVARIAFI